MTEGGFPDIWSHHKNPHIKRATDVSTVTCLLAHEWDPQNVRVPKILRTMEEEISRNIGAVMTEGGFPDLTDTDNDKN